ncbi:MAG: hypothetical protein M3O41_09360 [Pseudomonadota bacterium]|nr:hypothetical protein [Pseudomonadota bacterium]
MVALLAHLTDGTGIVAPQTITQVIITTVGVVLAAGLTAFAASFRRERSPMSTAESTAFATATATDIRKERDAAIRERNILRTMVADLRNVIWRLGYDPDVELAKGKGKHDRSTP